MFAHHAGPAADTDTEPLLPLADPEPGFAEDDTTILPVIDDEPPAPPDGDRRRRMALVALGVVAVLGIAVGIDIGLAGRGTQRAGPRTPVPASGSVASPSGTTPSGTTPSGTPTVIAPPPPSNPAPSTAALAEQRAQAQTVTALLARSAAARSGIGAAISGIGACKAIPAAVGTLDAAAAARANVAADLARTQLAALPGHAQLAADLTAAMSASASADRHYAAWGRAVAPHCAKHAAQTADFTAAQRDDTAATAAKRRFAAAWNPLATRIGVPPADPDKF